MQVFYNFNKFGKTLNYPNIIVKHKNSKRDEFLKKNRPFKREPRSQETKEKISTTMTGMKRDINHRVNTAEGKRGSKYTTEHRMNISKSLKYRKNSEKQNEMFFLSQKNTVIYSLEEKIQRGDYAVIGNELKGVKRPHYEEVKRKLKEDEH